MRFWPVLVRQNHWAPLLSLWQSLGHEVSVCSTTWECAEGLFYYLVFFSILNETKWLVLWHGRYNNVILNVGFMGLTMYPILEAACLVKQWIKLLNAYLRCLRPRTLYFKKQSQHQMPIYSTVFSRTGSHGSRNGSLEVGLAPLTSLLVSNYVIVFDGSATLSFVKLEMIFFFWV